MKRLYTFQADVNGKSVEVFVSKPSQADIEDGEYIYAKRFNRLLQDGFLSRAMMNKKFGDIGGIFSEKTSSDLSKSLLELFEARQRIEFYGSSKNLTPEQEEELKSANETYLILQKKITEHDSLLQNMFSNSADSKAEDYTLKWFVLYNSYMVSEIDEGDVKKKKEFKIFDKTTLEDKELQLRSFFEDIDSSDSEIIKLKKSLISKYFTLIGRVLAIWYNGLGDDQESIEKSLCEHFPDDYKKPAAKKKTTKAKEA